MSAPRADASAPVRTGRPCRPRGEQAVRTLPRWAHQRACTRARVDDRQERPPRANGLAVPARPWSGRSRPRWFRSCDPSGEQLADRDCSKGRMDALSSQVPGVDDVIQRLEVRGPHRRESISRSSQLPPAELWGPGLPVHRFEDAVGTVIEDQTRPIDPVALLLYVCEMPHDLVGRPGVRSLVATGRVVG